MSLREALIARGVLTPSKDGGACTPVRLPPGTPVYRIDPRAQAEAVRRARESLRVSLGDLAGAHERQRGDRP